MALTALSLQTWGLGNRRLSDHRERPQKGITPDPLPDGESGGQEGERPPDLDDDFFPVLRRNELREVFCVGGNDCHFAGCGSEGEGLGGQDYVNVQFLGIRRWSPLLSSPCPESG